MVAIFTYNLKIAEENFKALNCSLNTLTDYDHLIKTALEKEYITESDLKSLIEWRENPQAWGENI
jgi:orotate phosphoribosyltransferase